MDAQEARRILDRLYGYEVSPVLWKKVMPRLSAGRVQSVATRMIVERERERIAFRSASYWDIEGEFEAPEGTPKQFSATLSTVGGQRVATGKDFDDAGGLKKDLLVLGEAEAKRLSESLAKGAAKSGRSSASRVVASPAAPFMTSTLQQEAGAQAPFLVVAHDARGPAPLRERLHHVHAYRQHDAVRDGHFCSARAITELYGADYLPKAPRVCKNKVKNAQEARTRRFDPPVTHSVTPTRCPARSGPTKKVYELIWKRTVASQMEDSRGESVAVVIGVKAGADQAEFLVAAAPSRFLASFEPTWRAATTRRPKLENRERPLPPMAEGQKLGLGTLTPVSHETQPPARYTEASLVKRLEGLGVGRPSTYASIIGTILDRGYVWKRGTALVPSFRAFAVVGLLEQHFGDLVDYAFTARMEERASTRLRAASSRPSRGSSASTLGPRPTGSVLWTWACARWCRTSWSASMRVRSIRCPWGPMIMVCPSWRASDASVRTSRVARTRRAFPRS